MSKYVFTADVHLGLKKGDPAQRERRFVQFLENLDDNTAGLFCWETFLISGMITNT